MDILSFTRSVVAAGMGRRLGTVHAIELGRMELDYESSPEGLAFVADLNISMGIAIPGTQGVRMGRDLQRTDNLHDLVTRVGLSGGIRINEHFDIRLIGSVYQLTSALVQAMYGLEINISPIPDVMSFSVVGNQYHYFINGGSETNPDNPTIHATSVSLNFRINFDSISRQSF